MVGSKLLRARPVGIFAGEKSADGRIGSQGIERVGYAAHTDIRERIQVCDGGRQRTAQLIDRKVEILQIRQAAKFRRDTTAHLVIIDIKLLQIRQAADLRWDAASQLVSAEVYH